MQETMNDARDAATAGSTYAGTESTHADFAAELLIKPARHSLSRIGPNVFLS